ncbi:MAG: hypothetical protein JXB26_10245 [Candidatus Aminicenantes bacterium]|nr:hypothetical protein [Candidatus Aminicenantes bacterium]
MKNLILREKGWRGEGAPHTRTLWRGNSSAFPLPTVASLPASPSRASLCDQRGIPPWNPLDLYEYKSDSEDGEEP